MHSIMVFYENYLIVMRSCTILDKISGDINEKFFRIELELAGPYCGFIQHFFFKKIITYPYKLS